MGFRNWITKKASKTAETVIKQTKQTIQKNVENEVNLKGNALLTVGKLAVLGLIFAIAWKEGGSATSEPKSVSTPTSIIINNYMNERSKNDG